MSYYVVTTTQHMTAITTQHKTVVTTTQHMPAITMQQLNTQDIRKRHEISILRTGHVQDKMDWIITC